MLLKISLNLLSQLLLDLLQLLKLLFVVYHGLLVLHEPRQVVAAYDKLLLLPGFG